MPRAINKKSCGHKMQREVCKHEGMRGRERERERRVDRLHGLIVGAAVNRGVIMLLIFCLLFCRTIVFLRRLQINYGRIIALN